MKGIYRFRVDGKVRMLHNKPIQARHLTYEFETGEEDRLTHIRVTATLTNKEEWPQVLPSTEPGIRYDIRLHHMTLLFIQMELQGLEAALSLFGLSKIDIDYPEIEWLPESESERQALHILKFQEKVEYPSASFPLRFDVLARCIIAAIDLRDVELPLNFFRHGSMAADERRHIEAVYYFYFFFETLFGNGKTRNKAIKEEFKKSASFRLAVEEFLKNPPDFYPTEQMRKQALEKFGAYDADSLIDYIVDLRGFLHHHTARRRNMWHPSHQEDYLLDAAMFQQIALKVALGLVFTYLDDQRVMDEYGRLIQSLQVDSQS